MASVEKETLDEIINRIDSNVKNIKIQAELTNGRVSKLEQWKSKITGAILVIIFILTPVAYVVFDKLLH